MNVLIVDDDFSIVDVIREKINWKSLEVNEVYTAYQIDGAKKILSEHPIDVVISDIEMPQGSGLDLLAWFREQSMDGEFLLLTSHERFDYATDAIRLHASEYLLKPFDPAVMEVALRKVLQKCRDSRLQKENIGYGEWLRRNRRQLQLSFLRRKLEVREIMSVGQLGQELHGLELSEDPHAKYRLIVTRVTDLERVEDTVSPELLEFILTNIHSEIYSGDPENSRVISFPEKHCCLLVTVCDLHSEEEMEEDSRRLQQRFEELFGGTVTVCISGACEIPEFHDLFRECRHLVQNNVSEYGKVFLQSQVQTMTDGEVSYFDRKEMLELLRAHNKLDFLGKVKRCLNDRAAVRQLSVEMLEALLAELLQITYTYLGSRGLEEASLFEDADMAHLTEQATGSMVGMVRFVSFLLDRIVAIEEGAKQKDTLEDRIDQYLKEHFREDISTASIADEFHLNQEYLNKLYKKTTGKGIKDALNEYRMEEAGHLLADTDIPIGNVAAMVGLDNFTYFSTLFKKYTGSSPSQYRKENG